MPDTKMDEAIALAKEYEDGLSSGIVAKLARALLAATSPGARYRAWMEAAAEIADAAQGEYISLKGHQAACRGIAEDIRVAMAALPASPEPTVGIKQALREMDFHEYVVESDSEKASRLLMEAADFFAATLAKADSSAWKCP